MNSRSKYLPLTETTFYILIALRSPAHGYEIMQTVERLSSGEVRIAAGTMYGALENLTKQQLIQPIANDDPRRKMYLITSLGLEVLNLEILRIKQMLEVAEKGGC